MEQNKRISYWDTDLSIRGNNAFKQLNIEFLDEMAERSSLDLKELRSIGKQTIQEIRRVLGHHGLCLKGDVLVSSEEERKILTEIPELLRSFLNQIHEIDLKLNWMRHNMESMIESRKRLDTNQEWLK